jgi:hypothetical protein
VYKFRGAVIFIELSFKGLALLGLILARLWFVTLGDF